MRIITKEEVLAHRLRAHHLDTAITSLEVASSTCGFQNSPPGTWLCAAFNRLQEVTAKQLREQLDKQQGVIQAWSLRGAPWIFPVKDAAVFLDALCAKQEESWIYAGGLKHCQQDMKVPFELLLKELMECLRMLKQEPVISKQRLDTLLAQAMQERIPASLRTLWNSPSPYAAGQLFGEAIVSFLLRPASFQRGIIFGPRQKASPLFTSFPDHITENPYTYEEACQSLVCRFLHAYGPSDVKGFAKWTGMDPAQARRLWMLAEDECLRVLYKGKECVIWKQDTYTESITDRTMLLPAHDPYLDIHDRSLLLEDCRLQRLVWKTVQNPGAVIKNGRLCGIWKSRKRRQGIELEITLFEAISNEDIKHWAHSYEQFLEQEVSIVYTQL